MRNGRRRRRGGGCKRKNKHSRIVVLVVLVSGGETPRTLRDSGRLANYFVAVTTAQQSVTYHEPPPINVTDGPRPIMRDQLAHSHETHVLFTLSDKTHVRSQTVSASVHAQWKLACSSLYNRIIVDTQDVRKDSLEKETKKKQENRVKTFESKFYETYQYGIFSFLFASLFVIHTCQ